MAPEMMKKEVKFGPSVDIYSFGVVMWEVWCERKPWSELSDKQEIFKAVREDKRRLTLTNKIEKIEGYEELMRSCTEYEASRRPLIDSVRSDLQALLERAAEVESQKTAHSEPSQQGSMKLFTMMKDDDETKTTLENDERGTFLSGSQGSNSSSCSSPAVHIEMGSITAASPSSNKNKIEKVETKSGEGS